MKYAFDWEKDNVDGKQISNWLIATDVRMGKNGVVAFIYVSAGCDEVNPYRFAIFELNTSLPFKTIADAKRHADNALELAGYKTLPLNMKVLL